MKFKTMLGEVEIELSILGRSIIVAAPTTGEAAGLEVSVLGKVERYLVPQPELEVRCHCIPLQ